jgi:hypothetical protein
VARVAGQDGAKRGSHQTHSVSWIRRVKYIVTLNATTRSRVPPSRA